MEVRDEDLKIRKVKITDIKVFSKNYSNVSTRHIGNDVYVNHSNQTDEHERIYYEEENGAVGIIETINQQTLFKNGGDCILASIGNIYLGYKNIKQNLEISPLLLKNKENTGLMKKFASIFMFLLASVPLLSSVLYYLTNREFKETFYLPAIFKYSKTEENLFSISLILSVIFNLCIITGAETGSDSMIVLGILGTIILSAFAMIKYNLILKDFENKKEKLKNKITFEIERSN